MQEMEDRNESEEKRWYKSVVRRLLSLLYKDIVQPLLNLLYKDIVQPLLTPWFPDKHLKRREYIVDALSYIVVGITAGFARQYIQTDNPTVINISLMVSIYFLILGIYRLRRIYPHILLWIGVTYVFCAMPFLTVLTYYMSQMIPRARHTDRAISFMFLIVTIFEFFALISYLLDLYGKNRKNIKIHFNLKKISVFILGIITMGTALFQFLQVLLSFIHH